MSNVIERLKDKDDKKAYAYLKEVLASSEESDEFYELFDSFLEMVDSDNSYIRTRGFLLCCYQARWDQESKLNAAIPKMLALLNDPKATVVRQCLKALKEVIPFKNELCPIIQQAINNIRLDCYKDSMTGLIKKDIEELSELLK